MTFCVCMYKNHIFINLTLYENKTLTNDSALSLHVLHFFSIRLFLQSGPEVIKKISCSTQPSMKVFLLINVNMPTIVGILTFMSRRNCNLGLSEPETSRIS